MTGATVNGFHIFCTCSSSAIRLHGQQLDDSTRSLVERRALLFGVAGVAERDEEPALAAVLALALHDGLERVDVGAADLVGLLHLDGEPVVGEHAALVARLRADGEDAAVQPHVPHLHNPDQRDHRGVPPWSSGFRSPRASRSSELNLASNSAELMRPRRYKRRRNSSAGDPAFNELHS